MLKDRDDMVAKSIGVITNTFGDHIIPFEEYKDERGVFNLDHERMSDLSRFVKAQETDYERGADKTSRKQRCGDCYRKI